MAEVALKGGDKLTARLAEISKKLAKGGTLKVGFLSGGTYPDGTSVPLVAAIQEFGAPRAGIPPRPYFRGMIADKSPTWGDALAGLLKENDYDSTLALGLMGEGIAGQLRDSIIATDAPPLSPVTLMLRKMRSQDQSLVVTGRTVGEAAARVAAGESTAGVSTAVLKDTGHLLNSVGSEVKT